MRIDWSAYEEWFDDAMAKAQQMGVRAVRAYLNKLAKENLPADQAADYIKGIGAVTLTEHTISFELSRAAAEIEGNRGPRDMKPALLAAATKTAKDGSRYIDIPIRKSSPKRQHPRPFPAVTGEVDAFMRALQEEVGGQKVRAPRDAFRESVASKTVIMPGGDVAQVDSAAGYFQDVIKLAKGGAKADGDYMTIRRVSTKSDPQSWIYPGREGANFETIVQQYIQAAAPKIVEIAVMEAYHVHARKHRS